MILIRGVMPPELVLDMRRRWAALSKPNGCKAHKRRWFEHTSPSGVLKPGTPAVEGIFSGLDPDDFVGPDNASYLNGAKDTDNCAYYKLSAEGTTSDWAAEFASNRCEPRKRPMCCARLKSM